LGETSKSETRTTAAALALSAAERAESQEICFVSEGSYREYLLRRRPEAAQPGAVVDREGNELGRHEGIAFYTVGQRQGLGVSHKRPLYVLEIDAQHNRLIVGEEGQLDSHGLVMGDVNYVSMPGVPDGGVDLSARIRYGARLSACRAYPDPGGVRLEFVEPQRAVAPGQAAVCYEGEALAFGGTIEKAL
jgi:tRNA-specific 2-thiouridylase